MEGSLTSLGDSAACSGPRKGGGSVLSLARSLGAAGGVRLLGRPMRDGPAFGHGSDHSQGSQL